MRRTRMTEAIFAGRVLLNNALENWRDIATKLFRIFAHRKMTKFLHDDNFGAFDAPCRTQRIGWRTGKIILAGQEEKRALAGVDRRNAPAQIAVDAIKIQIPLEDAGAALLVTPQRFATRCIRSLRRDQSRYQRRANLAAVN